MDSDAKKQFPLRIPAALWAELEKWAADDLRSVNGQIEYLLRQAVVKRKGSAVPESSSQSPENESFSSPVTGPDSVG